MDRYNPVITGISSICSLGHHPEDTLERLLKNDSNFSKVQFKSKVFQDRRVAFVQDFNIRNYIKDRKTLRFMSKETQLSVCGVLLCLADSGITVNETYDENEIALFAGTGSSGMNLDDIENFLNNTTDDNTGLFSPQKFGQDALYKLNPLTSFKILPNMPPAVAAIYSNIKGDNLIFNPWEGNALLALYEALHEIYFGRANIVICGGSDCKTHSNAFITFAEYGLLEKGDIVLSEGSAYVCVESHECAMKRNAAPYCSIRNITHRSCPGPPPYSISSSEKFYAEIIEKALADSGLEPGDIDLVITSDDVNVNIDDAENNVIRNTFDHCVVLSPKKNIGNAFAAAGFLNVAIAAYILKHRLPVQEKKIHRILVTSFSPGSEKFVMIFEEL
jgi:3-oxoacyl-[acyl-carrier-protein] synthase II